MFFWRKIFFQTTSPSLNIESTKFIDSESQRNYIEEQVTLFNEYRNKQFDVDKKLMLASGALGIDAFLWIVRLPTTVAFLVAGGIILYAFPYAMRQQVAEQFNSQLEKLIKIYHWCEKDNGAKITHNATFIKVLEAIAPFVESKEIKLWNFRETRPEDISSRFAEIIAKPPHKIEIVMLKENESIGLDRLFTAKKTEGDKETNPIMEAKQAENKWYSLFDQSMAEVTRVIYGPKFEEPKPKPM